MMSRLHRIVLILIVLPAVFFLNGCIKGTSTVQLDEVEIFSAAALNLAAAQGRIHLQGDPKRNEEGSARIRTSLQVETYSLFGMAKPDTYLPLVRISPRLEEDTLVLATELEARSLWDRLLVRVVPRVDRYLDIPTNLRTSVDLLVGDVEAANLPGDLRIRVDAGHILVAPESEIVGEQRFSIRLGDLVMALPTYTAFRYDLQADLGTISTRNVALSLQTRFLGARASGVAGLPVRQGTVDAKVRCGSIRVNAE